MAEISVKTAGSTGSIAGDAASVLVGTGGAPGADGESPEMVQYHFPVEIEVRNGPAVDPEEVAKRALERLSSALKGT
jgi:hypothetical protein